jgi:hypothetical protein
MRSERPGIRIDGRSPGRSSRHLDGARLYGLVSPSMQENPGGWEFWSTWDARRNPVRGAQREAEKLGFGVSR